MRKTSESFCSFVSALVLVVAVFGNRLGQSARTPQNRERFVISARAGGVNAVTGRTGVHAKGSSVWEQLTIKDNLEGGDVVKTGLDGRVEILLNPGSYMRVGENSEFELTSNSLDNLEVRLLRGTAIVEATGAEDTELQINITTPHAKMAIVRRGLYRLNVVPGDLTELIVRKGRVLLADPETKVKGGKKLIFSGGSHSVAKLSDAEKKDIDSFDAWSRDRAKTVAKANERLTSRDRSFLRTNLDLWASRYSPRSGGFWLFDSSLGCYTFLPFYMGWGSPYGGSYASSFYRRYWYNTWNPYLTPNGYIGVRDASTPTTPTPARRGSISAGSVSPGVNPGVNKGFSSPKAGGGRLP